MKVAINIQADIQEIEVIINCMAEDENVQRIVSALDSLNTKLCCRRQGELFQIALNDILYIESVDRKTFIYTEQQIYETDKRLYELENHLKNRSFFRASKAVIINLKRTKSIRPEIGARLLLTMDNGEKVIVSRQYPYFPGQQRRTRTPYPAEHPWQLPFGGECVLRSLWGEAVPHHQRQGLSLQGRS